MAGKHISYSEWKSWYICPHYHKLKHIDNLSAFKGNIFTAFGKAMHTVCEVTLTKTDEYRSQEKIVKLLKESFVQELKALPVAEQVEAVSEYNLQEWVNDGIAIIPDLYRALVAKFGKLGEDWEVLAAEEQLYEPISEFKQAKKAFKGFIDLAAYTKKDKKVHLIDWKTCSDGWSDHKKSNKILAYQMVFYKHYYAKKYEVDLKDLECHFVLLKRTAEPGQKVDFVRVTAAKKRTQDALKSLTTALHNIVNKRYIKNRISCVDCPDRFGVCEFYNTEHCK